MDDRCEEKASALAKACRDAMAAIDAVAPCEGDEIMRHALSSLRAELRWCAKEYGEARNAGKN